MKKITVKTGQVMFSGEIYYYWPLNSSEKVDKIVGIDYWYISHSKKCQYRIVIAHLVFHKLLPFQRFILTEHWSKIGNT